MKMSNDGLNPNTNVVKQQDIIDLWYLATGDNLQKVNLATNSEVKDATLAGKAEYMKMVSDKAIALVYENPIYLQANQNLHIVNYANTHNFDSSNPQMGVENRTNNIAFKQHLLDKNPNDKTVVFFTGNLIGKEWKISDLNNAFIDEHKKILFWGLKTRLNQLIADIRFASKNGANQIILMNGREEHLAKQKLNVDVLSELVKEKFSDSLYEYVVKILNEDKTFSDSKVEIAYVKGVKKVFNIVRENQDDSISNYTLSMHTNLKTTSNAFKYNKSAAEKQHAGLAKADVVFIQGENAYGSIDDANIVFLTGQSRYANSTKGNRPPFAPKGRSSLTLLLGEKSHDVEIAWAMDLVNEDSYELERKLAEMREKEKCLIDLCEQKIEEKHKEFAKNQNSQCFIPLYKEVKGKGVDDGKSV